MKDWNVWVKAVSRKTQRVSMVSWANVWGSHSIEWSEIGVRGALKTLQFFSLEKRKALRFKKRQNSVVSPINVIQKLRVLFFCRCDLKVPQVSRIRKFPLSKWVRVHEYLFIGENNSRFNHFLSLEKTSELKVAGGDKTNPDSEFISTRVGQIAVTVKLSFQVSSIP